MSGEDMNLKSSAQGSTFKSEKVEECVTTETKPRDNKPSYSDYTQLLKTFSSCLDFKLNNEAHDTSGKKKVSHGNENGLSDRGHQLREYMKDDPTAHSEGSVCILPSFDLHSGDENITPLSDGDPIKSKESSAFDASADAERLEKAASKNISSKMRWTRSTVHLSPKTITESLSGTFKHLVYSRVRAWTLLLLRHSLSSGNENSRSNLLRLLATSSSINIDSISTKFQALNLPDINKSNEDSEGDRSTVKTNFKEIVLPLLFESSLTLALKDQQLTASLRAPGTISATFPVEESLINKVEVEIDANALVSSMIGQARLVIFKAISSAGLPLSNMSVLKSNNAASVFPKFNISLNLTSPTSGNIDKTNYSKMQRNTTSIQNMKTTTSNQQSQGLRRKTRSVTWNHPVETQRKDVLSDVDRRKRQKLSVSEVTLKSSKSYGKPDASFFESTRNATFAEFGRSHTNNNVPRFVNGRLTNAHAFTSYNFASQSGGDPSTQFIKPKLNASFSAASLSLAQKNSATANGVPFGGKRDLAQLVGLTRRKDKNSNGVEGAKTLGVPNAATKDGGSFDVSRLPRTPTAFEELLKSSKKF